MLYYWLKFPIRTGFRVFFRKVYFINEDKVPQDMPVLFASNHPTAFLDPILPAAYLDKALWFALRGDSFESKTAKFFLKEVHCLPFYRFGDGFQALRKNAITFKKIYSLLASGKFNFLIMAEGRHGHRKYLKPVQKGAANIAFGAMKKEKLENLAIVPVGFNYTDSDQFRSWVNTEYGDPIFLKDYMELYREDERKAIEEVTQELAHRLRKTVVHIEHKEEDAQVNRILDIQRNNLRIPVLPIQSSDPTMHRKEVRTADFLNVINQEDKEELYELLAKYDGILQQNKLRDLGLAQPNRYNIFNSAFLVLGFLPYLIGYGIHWPPFRFLQNLANRMAKKIEFNSSLRLSLGLFVLPIYWFILFIIALIAGAGWWSFLVITFPFIGYFALIYQEVFEKWNAARKVSAADEQLTNKLSLMREDLLGRLFN